ncbi:hypothetical protein BX661DRAFT_177833 [Kickxella alabastrina]|uniref:uncharacterized protein n=1 Tax=Kickxella alabastrina TaxID=61397 RepID=UPI002220F39B|nr:uncharacterized protein BX661DRAFT_177833 [Kickxella alabastrina]KAI7833932.1 hypothetical protein BX661DRAFT_177833 [Kickxella alabastrina]
MFHKTHRQLILFILKLTIFTVLFIEFTHIKLQNTTADKDMFKLPSAEEQQAKLGQFKYLLDDYYLEDDLPKEGEEAVQSAEPVTDTGTDGGDGGIKKVIRLSTLPQPLRVIKPGSRVTRDLRPNRLNVFIDENDKITRVDFF